MIPDIDDCTEFEITDEDRDLFARLDILCEVLEELSTQLTTLEDLNRILYR